MLERAGSTHRPGPFAILASWVIDGTGREQLDDNRQGVLISDGRIELVAARESVIAAARATDATILDATGCTLIPGLIDGHVHLAWNTVRPFTWRAESADDPALVDLAINSAQDVLASGVTTLRDCGAPRGVSVAARARMVARPLSAPRMIVAGPAVTTPGGHGEYLGITVADSPEASRTAVELLAAKGVDFIKVMATGGMTDPHTDRRRAQYTEASLRSLVAAAHARHMKVVAHANATEGIRRAVRAGVDTIAHCNWLGAEEGTLDYDVSVVHQMAAAGISVDLNLEGAMASLAGRDVADPSPETPEDRWGLFAEMRTIGVDIFLTSDRSGPSCADFPALLMAAADRWHLSADELVWRASGLPAKAMGIEHEVGSIAQGRIADLVLLDGDVRENVGALDRVVAVYRGGQRVSHPTEPGVGRT